MRKPFAFVILGLGLMGGMLVGCSAPAKASEKDSAPAPAVTEKAAPASAAPDADAVNHAPGHPVVPCPCEKGEVYVIHNPGKRQVFMCVQDGAGEFNAHVEHGDRVCCRFGEPLTCGRSH